MNIAERYLIAYYAIKFILIQLSLFVHPTYSYVVECVLIMTSNKKVKFLEKALYFTYRWWWWFVCCSCTQRKWSLCDFIYPRKIINSLINCFFSFSSPWLHSRRFIFYSPRSCAYLLLTRLLHQFSVVIEERNFLIF